MVSEVISAYSDVLFKWELFIQMRMAYFAPNLPLLHLFFGGRKEASMNLSFKWIGHYSTELSRYILK